MSMVGELCRNYPNSGITEEGEVTDRQRRETHRIFHRESDKGTASKMIGSCHLEKAGKVF